jgi:hypothetical protein
VISPRRPLSYEICKIRFKQKCGFDFGVVCSGLFLTDSCNVTGKHDSGLSDEITAGHGTGAVIHLRRNER